MKLKFPKIPYLAFLRRQVPATATVLADGLLFIAISAVSFPHQPWICLIAAVIAVIPPWLTILITGKTDKNNFVPDPCRPDMQLLAKSILQSFDSVLSGDNIDAVTWTLCPFCNSNGEFVTFSIDLKPAKNELIFDDGSGNPPLKVKTEISVHPRIPIPVTVFDTPVRFSINKAKTKNSVLLTEPRCIHFPWNDSRGNPLRNELIKIAVAIPLFIITILPDSPVLTPERLIIISAFICFFTIRCAERK